MNSESSYSWVRSFFLRGVGLIYLIAFLSLLPQIRGLIGEDGILPIQNYLDAIGSQLGASRYWLFPTLAWLDSSDTFLLFMCWSGVVLALVLIAGVLPLFVATGLYVLYLSLDTAGQTFLSFQWDGLLLEAGFAAILLAPSGFRPRYAEEPLRLTLWVPRFLIFRLMLESGAVKLLSGDRTWRSLTALDFHYETQPLPTPLAWYMHQLPMVFHEFSVVVMFIVELVVPFLFFMPRRLRITGAWATIMLQVLIAATGNYTFFNLLTIVLCITLFDDRHLHAVIPVRIRRTAVLSQISRRPVAIGRWTRSIASTILIATGLFQLIAMFGLINGLAGPLNAADRWVEGFHIVNRYGLFAVMTTSRSEIVVEGSNDGQAWRTYEFKFKPGNVDEPPRWVEPFQPRLDWQMWFAALSSYRDTPWFGKFMERLLEGSPDVVALLKTNPFPDKAPRYVRAIVYDYHFSDSATRRTTGAWWTRRYLGSYFPAVSLRR